jgi:small redox-active disulfide protein 2
MQIKVLGPGCANCHTLEKLTRQVLAESGLDAVVEKVEDFPTIVGFGVMSTPALVIDGDVVLQGKVPSLAVLRELIGARVD